MRAHLFKINVKSYRVKLSLFVGLACIYATMQTLVIVPTERHFDFSNDAEMLTNVVILAIVASRGARILKR